MILNVKSIYDKDDSQDQKTGRVQFERSACAYNGRSHIWKNIYILQIDFIFIFC